MYASAVLAVSDDENVLVPPAAELIIGIVSFGLLVAFFFWKVYPQIKRVYAERAERIEGGIERAERAQVEAQEMLERYRSELAEARADAARRREEAREQGRQIVEELRAQAQREAADIRARAEEQLAAERAQTVAQLRTEVGELALELAGRLVGHELTRDERQRELVDDFIAGLDAADTASGDGGRAPQPAGSAPAGTGG